MSQFGLFKTRRFAPFFFTQFAGAFNDNFFKNALLVLVVSATFFSAKVDVNLVNNVAAALFILPFFLFSALAGQLADKYPKDLIIRWVKLLEIGIMLFGALALYMQSLSMLLAVLFALGAQSTFFGPVKYAIIPQHLRPEELVAGNAQVEMGTFVAILLGTLLGAITATFDNGPLWVALATIAVAIAGYLICRQVPDAPAAAPELKINYNLFTQTVAMFHLARERQAVFLSILGISWFWLYGAVVLTQLPNYAVTVLMGTETVVSVLLGAFIIGTASGSLLCDRLSGHRVEMGLVPLGAFGLSLAGIDLWWSSVNFEPRLENGPAALLTQWQGIHILLDLMLIGISGGIYIVPLYAVVQSRTPEPQRARVIAANNIFNSLFMVVGSVIGILYLGPAGFSIPALFLLIAIMNIAVALFIFWQGPEFTMRFLVWLLSHSMYKVKHSGLGHIPERGAAIIVCNHVSFVDALLIAGSVRRPIRFVMYKPIYDIPVLNFVFRTGKTIPITSTHEDQAAYDAAMAAIAEGLDQGDLLCIFPEGKLTKDGSINEFKTGIERILEHNPVPVVPMALRGLWGSFFSHSDGGPFKAPFNRILSTVEVVAAAPIAPEGVSAAQLREVVLQMRGDWA